MRSNPQDLPTPCTASNVMVIAEIMHPISICLNIIMFVFFNL